MGPVYLPPPRLGYRVVTTETRMVAKGVVHVLLECCRVIYGFYGPVTPAIYSAIAIAWVIALNTPCIVITMLNCKYECAH